jgi:Zn-dependent peptidase ImmA (M78 family)/DNA-binding XRE family transcriptional regulator
MAALEAHINPALLVWARRTSGLTQEDAAKSLGVKLERLQRWETGDARLSVPQLRKAADKYKRPYEAFFLPTPPPDEPQVPDFRRRPDQHPPSAPLLAEIRKARYRRSVLLELSPTGGPELPVNELGGSTERSATALREALKVSIAQVSNAADPYAALALWITAVESRNVLVFQASRISTTEMRGLSIFEAQLPVILLNGGDAVRARAFTLMHELAHISFRAGGLCDLEGSPNSQAAAVETACNRVAAAVLVPQSDLGAHFAQPSDWDLPLIRSAANRYWVSGDVMLLRLLQLGQISERRFDVLKKDLDDSYDPTKAKGGGGDYYRTFVRNSGYRYTSALIDAYEQERITPAEFAQFTGAKVNHVAGIARVLQNREIAQRAS